MNEVVNGNTAMSDEEKKAVIGMHLSGLLCAVSLPAVIPCVVMIFGMHSAWLIHREQMPFIDHQGKNLLNFHISMAIYATATFVLSIALFLINATFSLLSELRGFFTWRPEQAQFSLPVFVIFTVLMGTLWILAVKYSITALSQSKRGLVYQYPLAIRFFK